MLRASLVMQAMSVKAIGRPDVTTGRSFKMTSSALVHVLTCEHSDRQISRCSCFLRSESYRWVRLMLKDVNVSSPRYRP